MAETLVLGEVMVSNLTLVLEEEDMTSVPMLEMVLEMVLELVSELVLELVFGLVSVLHSRW